MLSLDDFIQTAVSDLQQYNSQQLALRLRSGRAFSFQLSVKVLLIIAFVFYNCPNLSAWCYTIQRSQCRV